ncbi:hypothetical protein DSUL_90035 [Desulfovibrionales bacterium]
METDFFVIFTYIFFFILGIARIIFLLAISMMLLLTKNGRLSFFLAIIKDLSIVDDLGAIH